MKQCKYVGSTYLRNSRSYRSKLYNVQRAHIEFSAVKKRIYRADVLQKWRSF